MKKFVLGTLLVLLIGSVSTQAISTDIEKGYISVSTSSNAELVPDVAEVSIAVQTFDNKSMQKATLQNKEIAEKIISNLKTKIDTSKGDYIKTSNYNASPVYTTVGNKRVLEKYQVSNSVVVHTKSIDKVGSMIDESIALGATNVNNLSFSVSDYENKCNELLGLAAQRAKERAEVVLKTVPATISGVRTIDMSCSANNTFRPQYRLMKANMVTSSAETTSTTIENGVVKIFANVNASYFVK